ncbi:MAG: hypothetical protein A2687_01490 [Candidatus Levybacteria bacterium RIFCSPHIGHO2_01_FULL_38_26]|nr:MAG: hypothetical protein A2687_01490 [Candidatus Levybacteria bacterium RIFCSPHIGHO2_01_FULL_38_26]
MNSLGQGPEINPIILFGIFFWSIFWKGLALWHSAKFNQRNWFIAMLVVNIAGILEIIYLFRFAKERMTIKNLISLIKGGLKV